MTCYFAFPASDRLRDTSLLLLENFEQGVKAPQNKLFVEVAQLFADEVVDVLLLNMVRSAEAGHSGAKVLESFAGLIKSTVHGLIRQVLGKMARVSASDTGKPAFLAEWEEKAIAGQDQTLPAPFDDPFFAEWLTLPPSLADTDLRGALYVSREHAPLITPEDRLSSEAAELLTALLQHPEMAASLKERLLRVPRTEITIVMDRLLDRARQEQEWGVPAILEACLIVAEADPPQGARLAAFLGERPAAQVQANIVPKIGDQPWAKGVFDIWDRGQVSRPVKTAIKRQRENGNLAV
ncbi:MAG: hypothetical protein ACK4UT_07210 [Moraxellaceae bacterium]